MKGDAAFRTISEVAADTGVAPHVLRYWETRFPQLRPLQRAGNRRYYRPADIALVRRIDALLNQQGYTVKGVQKLFAEGGIAPATGANAIDAAAAPVEPSARPITPDGSAALLAEVRAIRDALATALAQDRADPMASPGPSA